MHSAERINDSHACPKCGLIKLTWAAQENEEGGWEHDCPQCMHTRIVEIERDKRIAKYEKE